jgi:hypothetical protein
VINKSKLPKISYDESADEITDRLDMLELSEDSEEEKVQASKTSAIFVKCNVKDDPNYGLELVVNSQQRPKVRELKRVKDGVQGDHVTSYASFIAALVNSSDQSSASDLSTTLRKIAQAIMPNQSAVFSEIKDAKTHDRNKRKTLTALLTFAHEKKGLTEASVSKLNDDHPSKIILQALPDLFKSIGELKADLKYGALAKDAQVVEELGNLFLEKIQNEKAIAFPSKGRVGKVTNEGKKTDEAINALNAINALYRLIRNLKSKDTSIDDKKDLVRSFTASLKDSRNPIKLGFNKLFRISFETETSNQTKNQNSKGKKIISSTLNRKAVSATQILADSLEKKLSLRFADETIKSVKSLLIGIDAKLIPHTDTLGELFATLFDFQRTVEFPDRTETRDVNYLYTLASRHVVVMFTAFNELTTYLCPQDKLFTIQNFLEQIIKKQGWNQCKELGSSEESCAVKLEKEVMKRIDFTDSDYKLKPEQKKIQPSLKKSQAI